MPVRWNNNCYNYATNRVTNSFAQPGEASGEYLDLNCESVYSAASKDLGLVPAVPFDHKYKTEETLIALVVAPQYDFHWYRRDDNNLWSHKPGATEATRFDQSDAYILSPETADRGPYTKFCGYFKVTNYIVEESEQNSGYVRIGNMTDLPDLTEESSSALDNLKSEVEILLYSGRKNPKLPLSSIAALRDVSALIKKLEQELQTQKRTSMPGVIPSKLGYNGILIRDSEGLMFKKGTSVHLKDDLVVINKSDGRAFQFKSALAQDLERYILLRSGISLPVEQ
jgi:hypothetical protein